jgi:hypothetical protein
VLHAGELPEVQSAIARTFAEVDASGLERQIDVHVAVILEVDAVPRRQAINQGHKGQVTSAT